MYFSVIIPLFNKEKHIKRAIHSVLTQTYQKFELIVVDDGSTDNSVKKLNEIQDPRINLIQQNNTGVSAARNKGISVAKYNYIGFLDADDMWNPDYLLSIKNLIENYPGAGAYSTAYEIKKKDGTLETSLNVKNFGQEWKGIIDDYFKYAIVAPLLTASSVVIPKIVFKNVGKFEPGIKRGEDLEMWCRIALAYDIAYLNTVCATYFHDAENRACNKKAILSESSVAKAVESYVKVKKKINNHSDYAEEYMIKNIIIKAKYLIDDDKCKKARDLLFKYRHTRFNRKLLIKTYIISWIPRMVKPLVYSLRDRLKSSGK